MCRLPPLALPALFSGLLAQAAALIWLCALPVAPLEGGEPHPRLPILRVAPESFEAAAPLSAPTLLYGAGALVALFALLALGFGGGQKLRRGRGAFTLAALAVAGAASALWFVHRGAPHARDGLAGLPPGSAWLLFGLWPAEALFAWAYVLHFRALIWPPSSEVRFAALLAERDRSSAETHR
ncbi:MAG: hypothetical protein JNM84_05245 [Planctomycetes bacterium]|nr:hypothetical protein [Planctomycetota bacterium]